MAKTVKFQSISVKYPIKLFACGIWMKSDELRLLTLDNMHESFNKLKIHSKVVVNFLNKYSKKNNSSSKTLEAIMVIGVSFLKNFLLKKSYWKKSNHLFNQTLREVSFIDAINKPKLYNLAVTPVIKTHSTKKHIFNYTAAFPYIKTQEEQVGNLMENSDIFVSPEAKNAGIYSIEQVYGYDLENDEVVLKENSFIN